MLASRSRVSQQSISKIERGHQAGSAAIVQLAAACKVRPEWLASGTGTMSADGAQPPGALRQPCAEYGTLPAEALEIARAWLRLPEDRRVQFRKTLFLEAAVLSFYPRLEQLSRAESWSEFENAIEGKLTKFLTKAIA